MASSGSVDFSVTRDQIIQSVLEDLEIMQPGDTTSSTSFTEHSSGLALKLNALIKQWGNPTDGSPGMQVWAQKIGYLFLNTNNAAYTLGPTTTETGTTNKWASSYVTTTLGSAAAANDSTITLSVAASTLPIASGNRIGIELDSGAMFWTTVNGSPSGAVCTLTTNISGAASAGNRVFAYATTAQGRRPLEIITALRRDTDGNDSPVGLISLEGYEYGVLKKNQDSTPTQAYYKPTLTDGTLYLDAEPTDVTDVIRIVYRSPFEDFDAASDNPDFDQHWIRPLIYGLAVESLGRFSQESRLQYFASMREESLRIARNFYPETCELYFQPGDSA